MDAPEWNGSEVCGACVSVQGPIGTVTVRIVDLCPGCEEGHLDLSQEAFAKIADVSAGNVPITWVVVPCDVTGDLVYEYKDGTSQWWTAIQVRNSRRVVKSLEWMANGVWTRIPRESYNYFLVSSGVGPDPIKVRITALTGEQLVDMLPAPASALSVQGSVQFIEARHTRAPAPRSRASARLEAPALIRTHPNDIGKTPTRIPKGGGCIQSAMQMSRYRPSFQHTTMDASWARPWRAPSARAGGAGSR